MICLSNIFIKERKKERKEKKKTFYVEIIVILKISLRAIAQIIISLKHEREEGLE